MVNLLDLMMEEKPIFEKQISKSISPTRKIRDSVPEIPFFQNTRKRLKRAIRMAKESEEKVKIQTLNGSDHLTAARTDARRLSND